MTKENDVVLIYVENMPAGFARVESILADSKKDWYHIKLLFLQIPLQVVTWILKDSYINGEEFSMAGKKMRLERVKCPEEENIIHENSSVDNITRFQGKKDKSEDILDKSKNKIIERKAEQNKHTTKNKQDAENQQDPKNKQAEIISLADIRKSKKKK